MIFSFTEKTQIIGMPLRRSYSSSINSLWLHEKSKEVVFNNKINQLLFPLFQVWSKTYSDRHDNSVEKIWRYYAQYVS